MKKLLLGVLLLGSLAWPSVKATDFFEDELGLVRHGLYLINRVNPDFAMRCKEALLGGGSIEAPEVDNIVNTLPTDCLIDNVFEAYGALACCCSEKKEMLLRSLIGSASNPEGIGFLSSAVSVYRALAFIGVRSDAEIARVCLDAILRAVEYEEPCVRGCSLALATHIGMAHPCFASKIIEFGKINVNTCLFADYRGCLSDLYEALAA